MRRLGAVVLALVVAAPSASAAAPRPVVGGGSFNDAPIIGAGSFRDTILPGEELIYGVRLRAGERLHLRASMDTDEATFKAARFNALQASVRGPLREDDVLSFEPGETKSSARPAEAIDLTTEPAQTRAGGSKQGIIFRGPGVYYFALNTLEPMEPLAKLEIPLRIDVAVEGAPQPEPRVAAPQPLVRPKAPAVAKKDDGGPSAPVLIGVGLLAALLGAAAAFSLARPRAARG